MHDSVALASLAFCSCASNSDVGHVSQHIDLVGVETRVATVVTATNNMFAITIISLICRLICIRPLVEPRMLTKRHFKVCDSFVNPLSRQGQFAIILPLL
jgi:hypothetical protein